MARRSAADKADTRERIVRRASHVFRGHGSGVGIGEVMKDLGLTHGGFYRHFQSKDDLLVEAISSSLAEVAERLERVGEQAPPGRALAAIIEAYLSPEHLRHPETWCALATLAPDIGRLSASVRKRLDRAFAGYLGRLAAYMPGNDEQERGQNFIILFSGMAGAMAMARALGDRDMRERVLTVTREHYLTVFAGKR